MECLQSILADQFWFSVILMAVSIGVILTGVAYCILLERKISAWVQDRYGPNRVGPQGLFQPIADGVKFLLKEDITPAHVEKAIFLLAPWLIFVVAMVGFAVIPWGGTFRWSWMAADAAPMVCQVATVDIGLLYMVAMASLGVYGVVLGAWASNNKYSFFGGMRAAAQMLSYEVPLGMALLVVIMTTGELRLENMIDYQAAHQWSVLYHPLAALLLFIAALAEANRMPFDLAETEQELVGGYHTEYSAMKFAMFFLGEYTHMITTSFLMVILFFGGWHFPLIATAESGWVLKLLVFGGKMFLFIVFYMLVRWTIPRFRFDQLMGLAWRVLIPLSLINLVSVMIVKEMQWSPWLLLPANLAALFGSAVLTLAGDKEEKPAAA